MDIFKKDLFCTKCLFTFGNDYTYHTHIKLVKDIESNLIGSKDEPFESESKFQPYPDLDKQIVSVHHVKKCEICEKNFTKIRYQNRHISLVHEKEELEKCALFCQSFSEQELNITPKPTKIRLTRLKTGL